MTPANPSSAASTTSTGETSLTLIRRASSRAGAQHSSSEFIGPSAAWLRLPPPGAPDRRSANRKIKVAVFLADCAEPSSRALIDWSYCERRTAPTPGLETPDLRALRTDPPVARSCRRVEGLAGGAPPAAYLAPPIADPGARAGGVHGGAVLRLRPCGARAGGRRRIHPGGLRCPNQRGRLVPVHPVRRRPIRAPRPSPEARPVLA